MLSHDNARSYTPSSDDASTIDGDVESVQHTVKEKDVDIFVDIEVARKSALSIASVLNNADVDAFPEGGLRAWLVVIGAAAGLFTTYGLFNSWGVFQAYYEETLLPDRTASEIAWIGSIQTALAFIPGAIMGQLFDRGILKVPLLTASVGYVIAIALVAECRSYWQFLLCQGIFAGGCMGIIFAPQFVVITQWFDKKKGIAYGAITVGTSLGGLAIPFLLRNLIPRLGFQWAMRILALVVGACLVLTNLTVARRLPADPQSGVLVSLRVYRNPAYIVYSLSGLLIYLTMYSLMTFIDASAVYAGVDRSFAIYLVSIINAVTALSRIGGGLLVDRFGPLNVMIPASLSCGVLTFIWPIVKTKVGFGVLAGLYGATSGVFGAMFAAPLTAMGKLDDMGVRFGMFCAAIAIGDLTGPPISGAINTATGDYLVVGLYAGAGTMIAVALLIYTKYLLLGTIKGHA